MNDKKQESKPIEATVSATDMVELKRDMQHAQVTAWLQKNQQQLIAGAVVFALVLIGFSLWKEQQNTQKESAALLYMKATNVQDKEQRAALLASVRKDYAQTGYATLATLQQSKLGDDESRKASLQALVDGHGLPEVVWQARLDLAVLHIDMGDAAAAKALLATRLGKHYEQARYALLAQVEEEAEAKAGMIQKALDAESHDTELVAKLEAELALLKAAQ